MMIGYKDTNGSQINGPRNDVIQKFTAVMLS
jgi:hypothetical protein